MVEESLLPRIGMIDVKHEVGEVLLTVKGIEVSQEIYYVTFVFIIRNQVLHKFLEIVPKLWESARVYVTRHRRI
jgi:hypothetical protein